MIAYLLKDDDPHGGYFAAEDHKPDIRVQRKTLAEIRRVELPDEVWQMVVTGALPVDEDFSNDSTWIQWWQDPSAEIVWVR